MYECFGYMHESSLPARLVSLSSGKVNRLLRTVVIENQMLPHGYWKLNPSTLEKDIVHLTTEVSLFTKQTGAYIRSQKLY